MKSLRLFNAVLYHGGGELVLDNDLGIIIEPGASWAIDRIEEFYHAERLSGNDLNKTFHKSWAVIKNSSRCELLTHQILHYLSGYGTDFKGEVYIPNEVLNVPEMKKSKLKYVVIKGITREDMILKCFELLQSGVALKEETLDDLLSVLVDECGYKFTGLEYIKNKEAIVKIADMYGIYPSNRVDFLRYLVYKSTLNSLLIKNDEVINAIKGSSFNPGPMINKYGLVKLSAIFNRFKPLFLAWKGKCPKVINKLSKLSKVHHTPMIENPLNHVTHLSLTQDDMKWLKNATPYALLRALKALHNRIHGQDTFVYKVRNGKSFVMNKPVNKAFLGNNYQAIIKELQSRDHFTKTIYIPKGIEYGLPTSEKMFIGNVPMGTMFTAKRLAVGVYWENEWGARDLDLSSVGLDGTKVGWNSAYANEGLYYSGDMTDATNGAVEYLYSGANPNFSIVKLNVFSGKDISGYKMVIGKGNNVDKDYMMNPNKLFAQFKCETVSNESIIGLLMPGDDDKQRFVLTNLGAGYNHVSGGGHLSTLQLKALIQEYQYGLTLNRMLLMLGYNITHDKTDEVDVSLGINDLDKSTILNLFTHGN